uniref:DUF7356 domain-containing protein n=1 Tax=Kalanchoe fedtschenkoi TaxID=63787 RepID=A0A7N0UTR8_KALFE
MDVCPLHCLNSELINDMGAVFKLFLLTKVPVEASLLVQNGGEGTLRVNASISPDNLSFTDIILLKSQARKINVSAILRGNQLINLTSGNESCVIHIGLSVPEGPVAEENFFQKLPYVDQVTPIHGVILLSVTLLIISGIWACCKSRTSERQGDGIPYQELEMGQSNSTAAVNMEDGGGGWDEVWDDDWDDDQEAIKSPSQDHHEPNASSLAALAASGSNSSHKLQQIFLSHLCFAAPPDAAMCGGSRAPISRALSLIAQPSSSLNTQIKSFAQQGHHLNALNLYATAPLQVTAFTFPCLVKSAASLSSQA